MRQSLSHSPTRRSEKCHLVAGWLCSAAEARGETDSDGLLEDPSQLRLSRNVKDRDVYLAQMLTLVIRTDKISNLAESLLLIIFNSLNV